MAKQTTLIFKNETISLVKIEYTERKIADDGFWLYDKTRGMNLSMRAKTETDAFVEALMYYQKRLLKFENTLKNLKGSIENHLESLSEQFANIMNEHYK